MFNFLLAHPSSAQSVFAFVSGCRILSEKIYVKHADYIFMSSNLKWGSPQQSFHLFILKHFSFPIPTILITNFITFMFPSLPPISCSKSNYLPHINKIRSSDMTSSIHTLIYLILTYTQLLNLLSTVCLLFSRANPPTCCSWSHLSPLQDLVLWIISWLSYCQFHQFIKK